MRISDEAYIKSVGITTASGSRYLTFDPPIKVEPGDFFAVSPRTGRIRLIRYEDALLEPEWEIFQ